MPGQSLLVKLFHERIGIELLYVPYTRSLPQTFEEHHGANHGRNTGGVSNSLGANFFVAFFMVTDVVEVVGFVLAVLFAAEDAADVGYIYNRCVLCRLSSRGYGNR